MGYTISLTKYCYARLLALMNNPDVEGMPKKVNYSWIINQLMNECDCPTIPPDKLDDTISKYKPKRPSKGRDIDVRHDILIKGGKEQGTGHDIVIKGGQGHRTPDNYTTKGEDREEIQHATGNNNVIIGEEQ